MTRTDLYSALHELDLPGRHEETVFRSRMIELLESAPECFKRSCFLPTSLAA